MRTRLFQWAAGQKLEMEDLAAMTGYTARHLYRIRALEEAGEPVPDEFQARVVLKLGDWARSLFLPGVPRERVEASQSQDTPNA
jgi:hypothetical protein